MPKAAQYITQFDSSTSMLYALSNALRGEAFKGVGVVPSGLEFIPAALNSLPYRIRQRIYRWSGWWAALERERLEAIRAEEISGWVTSRYPRRRYPAMMIGASNGAAIHLGTAMGIPWLPQTFLVAVRRELPPDEIEADIQWGRETAKVLRRNNPELKVNQMHDPVQDRLMVAKMGYFRLKRIRLGETYERFIRQSLEPGGTLFIIDCRLQWPVVSVANEHTFQVGGLGEIAPFEYLQGSPRLEAFLREHGSSVKSWPLPGRVYEIPEAEWGFDPRLGEDVERLAKTHGYRIQRIVFNDPEALSPLVADLYKWWYEKRGIHRSRLLVECFALIEPWMTVRTGSVPFWLAFNTEPSAEILEFYLKKGTPFDEIYLMLMSNGVEGVGQIPIERWKIILGRARVRGELLGVDAEKYPLDFQSFIRYHAELKEKISESFDPPSPLLLQELDEFLAGSQGRYQVSIQNDGKGAVKNKEGYR